ncbi:MAG: Ig-like domain-containing protein [Oscillatoria sp. PMC 1068.18]|nr:Ig-like domain-containing protein [Oscillatoria sp. PMC 1068.18]
MSIDTRNPQLTINPISENDSLNLRESSQDLIISGTAIALDGEIVTVNLNGKEYTSEVIDDRWTVVIPVEDVEIITETDKQVFQVNAEVGSASVNLTQFKNLEVSKNPPVFNPTNPQLPTITEDETTHQGEKISELVDTENLGIVIIAVNNNNGNWQYTVDESEPFAFTINDDGSLIPIFPGWRDLPLISEEQGLLLGGNHRLRFVPNEENGGEASLTYRAWDQFGLGEPGEQVDARIDNENTNFSPETDTIEIEITSVNDAPQLKLDVDLEPIEENDIAPENGRSLSEVFGIAIADPDESSSLEGFAVVGFGAVGQEMDSSQGKWQYSLDGLNWLDINLRDIDRKPTEIEDKQELSYEIDNLQNEIRQLNDNYYGSSSEFDWQDKLRKLIENNVADREFIDGFVENTVGTSYLRKTEYVYDRYSGRYYEQTRFVEVTQVDEYKFNNYVYNQVADLLEARTISQKFLDELKALEVFNDQTYNQLSNLAGEYYDRSHKESLALNPFTQIRFLPANNFTGKPLQMLVTVLDNSYTGGFTSAQGEKTIDINKWKPTSYFAFEPSAVGVEVVNVNDAPSFDNVGELAAINEDSLAAEIVGETIANLFSDKFVDADPGDTLSGILIVSNPNNSEQGEWQYSTDDGNTWLKVGTVDDVENALALDIFTKIRFVPVSNFSGAVDGLEVRALDSTYDEGFTQSSDRYFIDSRLNGNESAIAGETQLLQTTIKPQNDRPVLDITNNKSLTTITEDDLDNLGTRVGDLIANKIEDADINDPQGIAITSANNQNGQWQYRLSSTSTWYNIGTVSDNFSLRLSENAYIRFLPNGENGTTTTLKYRAYVSSDTNQLSGTKSTNFTQEQSLRDVVSEAEQTVTLKVNSLNDSPRLTNSKTLATPTNWRNPSGQTVESLFASQVSDVDSNWSFEGIVVSDNFAQTLQGSWQYSVNDGLNWIDIIANPERSLVLSRQTKIRFLPLLSFTGTPGNLKIRALDNTYTGEFSQTDRQIYLDTTNLAPTSPVSNSVDLSSSYVPQQAVNLLGTNNSDILDNVGGKSVSALAGNDTLRYQPTSSLTTIDGGTGSDVLEINDNWENYEVKFEHNRITIKHKSTQQTRIVANNVEKIKFNDHEITGLRYELKLLNNAAEEIYEDKDQLSANKSIKLLPSNSRLKAGDVFTSPNGEYSLSLQDGVLVFSNAEKQIWSSGLDLGATEVRLEANGYLVFYDREGDTVLKIFTGGGEKGQLFISNEGSFGVSDRQGKITHLFPQILELGETITSPSGKYEFGVSSFWGSIIFYLSNLENNQLQWGKIIASDTSNENTKIRAALKASGELVVERLERIPQPENSIPKLETETLWSSKIASGNTSLGLPSLMVTDTGNFGIWRPDIAKYFSIPESIEATFSSLDLEQVSLPFTKAVGPNNVFYSTTTHKAGSYRAEINFHLADDKTSGAINPNEIIDWQVILYNSNNQSYILTPENATLTYGFLDEDTDFDDNGNIVRTKKLITDGLVIENNQIYIQQRGYAGSSFEEPQIEFKSNDGKYGFLLGITSWFNATAERKITFNGSSQTTQLPKINNSRDDNQVYFTSQRSSQSLDILDVGETLKAGEYELKLTEEKLQLSNSQGEVWSYNPAVNSIGKARTYTTNLSSSGIISPNREYQVYLDAEGDLVIGKGDRNRYTFRKETDKYTAEGWLETPIAQVSGIFGIDLPLDWKVKLINKSTGQFFELTPSNAKLSTTTDWPFGNSDRFLQIVDNGKNINFQPGFGGRALNWKANNGNYELNLNDTGSFWNDLEIAIKYAGVTDTKNDQPSDFATLDPNFEPYKIVETTRLWNEGEYQQSTQLVVENGDLVVKDAENQTLATLKETEGSEVYFTLDDDGKLELLQKSATGYISDVTIAPETGKLVLPKSDRQRFVFSQEVNDHLAEGWFEIPIVRTSGAISQAEILDWDIKIVDKSDFSYFTLTPKNSDFTGNNLAIFDNGTNVKLTKGDAISWKSNNGNYEFYFHFTDDFFADKDVNINVKYAGQDSVVSYDADYFQENLDLGTKLSLTDSGVTNLVQISKLNYISDSLIEQFYAPEATNKISKVDLDSFGNLVFFNQDGNKFSLIESGNDEKGAFALALDQYGNVSVVNAYRNTLTKPLHKGTEENGFLLMPDSDISESEISKLTVTSPRTVWDKNQVGKVQIKLYENWESGKTEYFTDEPVKVAYEILLRSENPLPLTAQIKDINYLGATAAEVNSNTDANRSGIAITQLQEFDQGIWQYSPDGKTWRNIGNVSDSNALFLGADSYLRFVPESNEYYPSNLSFRYKLWRENASLVGKYGRLSSENVANEYQQGAIADEGFLSNKLRFRRINPENGEARDNNNNLLEYAIANVVVIPSGSSTAEIDILPLVDSIQEQVQTVDVRIKSIDWVNQGDTLVSGYLYQEGDINQEYVLLPVDDSGDRLQITIADSGLFDAGLQITDEYGFPVKGELKLNHREGEPTVFYIALTSRPAHDVKVKVNDLTLTFSSDRDTWDRPQKVTLTNQKAGNTTNITVASLDPFYNALGSNIIKLVDTSRVLQVAEPVSLRLGKDVALQLPHNLELQGNYAIQFWLKPESTDGVILRSDSGELRLENGILKGTERWNFVSSEATQLSLDRWNKIALIEDNQNLILYLNGEKVSDGKVSNRVYELNYETDSYQAVGTMRIDASRLSGGILAQEILSWEITLVHKSTGNKIALNSNNARLIYGNNSFQLTGDRLVLNTAIPYVSVEWRSQDNQNRFAFGKTSSFSSASNNLLIKYQGNSQTKTIADNTVLTTRITEDNSGVVDPLQVEQFGDLSNQGITGYLSRVEFWDNLKPFKSAYLATLAARYNLDEGSGEIANNQGTSTTLEDAQILIAKSSLSEAIWQAGFSPAEREYLSILSEEEKQFLLVDRNNDLPTVNINVPENSQQVEEGTNTPAVFAITLDKPAPEGGIFVPYVLRNPQVISTLTESTLVTSEAKWAIAQASGSIQLEFAPETNYIVTSYQITANSSDRSQDVTSWRLLGSHDGINYTELDVRTQETFADRNAVNTYQISENNTAYRFYLLEVTDNNGGSQIQLGNLQLFSFNNPETNLPTEITQQPYNVRIANNLLSENSTSEWTKPDVTIANVNSTSQAQLNSNSSEPLQQQQLALGQDISIKLGETIFSGIYLPEGSRQGQITLRSLDDNRAERNQKYELQIIGDGDPEATRFKAGGEQLGELIVRDADRKGVELLTLDRDYQYNAELDQLILVDSLVTAESVFTSEKSTSSLEISFSPDVQLWQKLQLKNIEIRLSGQEELGLTEGNQILDDLDSFAILNIRADYAGKNITGTLVLTDLNDQVTTQPFSLELNPSQELADYNLLRSAIIDSSDTVSSLQDNFDLGRLLTTATGDNLPLRSHLKTWDSYLYVRLKSAPQNPDSQIVIDLQASQGLGGTQEIELSTQQITFAAKNWQQPVLVGVRGINDIYADPAQQGVITAELNQDLTTDTAYLLGYESAAVDYLNLANPETIRDFTDLDLDALANENSSEPLSSLRVKWNPSPTYTRVIEEGNKANILLEAAAATGILKGRVVLGITNPQSVLRLDGEKDYLSLNKPLELGETYSLQFHLRLKESEQINRMLLASQDDNLQVWINEQRRLEVRIKTTQGETKTFASSLAIPLDESRLTIAVAEKSLVLYLNGINVGTIALATQESFSPVKLTHFFGSPAITDDNPENIESEFSLQPYGGLAYGIRVWDRAIATETELASWSSSLPENLPISKSNLIANFELNKSNRLDFFNSVTTNPLQLSVTTPIEVFDYATPSPSGLVSSRLYDNLLTLNYNVEGVEIAESFEGVRFGTRFFFLTPVADNWSELEAIAQRYGGSLAVIDTPELNNLLAETLADQENVAIGLRADGNWISGGRIDELAYRWQNSLELEDTLETATQPGYVLSAQGNWELAGTEQIQGIVEIALPSPTEILAGKNLVEEEALPEKDFQLPLGTLYKEGKGNQFPLSGNRYIGDRVAIAAADFNNDSQPDLLVFSEKNGGQLFLNNSTLTEIQFQRDREALINLKNIQPALNGREFKLIDLNEDSLVDLVWNDGEKIVWLENQLSNNQAFGTETQPVTLIDNTVASGIDFTQANFELIVENNLTSLLVTDRGSIRLFQPESNLTSNWQEIQENQNPFSELILPADLELSLRSVDSDRDGLLDLYVFARSTDLSAFDSGLIRYFEQTEEGTYQDRTFSDELTKRLPAIGNLESIAFLDNQNQGLDAVTLSYNVGRYEFGRLQDINDQLTFDFTGANSAADLSQILEVYSIDDQIAEGDERLTLRLLATEDFALGEEVERTVDLIISDNDESGINLEWFSGDRASAQTLVSHNRDREITQLDLREGINNGGFFTVSLASQPSKNVTVNTVSTNSETFRLERIYPFKINFALDGTLEISSRLPNSGDDYLLKFRSDLIASVTDNNDGVYQVLLKPEVTAQLKAELDTLIAHERIVQLIYENGIDLLDLSESEQISAGWAYLFSEEFRQDLQETVLNQGSSVEILQSVTAIQDIFEQIRIDVETNDPTYRIGGSLNANQLFSERITTVSSDNLAFNFTTLNWEQKIFVRPVATEDLSDNTEQTSPNLLISTSSLDNQYNALDLLKVPVQIADNDRAEVIINNFQDIREGVDGQFEVNLASQPNGEVTITLTPENIRGLTPNAARGLPSHSYTLIEEAMTWQQAQQRAWELGGHLVSINSQAEQDFLVDNFGSQVTEGFWIGLHRQNWLQWDNGETVDYGYWQEGEPSFTDYNEHFAYVNAQDNFTWHDGNSELSLPFIVELDDPDRQDLSLNNKYFGQTIELTFDETNWNLPQQVTVRPQDNPYYEGSRESFVYFDVASTDPSYDQFAVDPVSVQIRDNDVPVAKTFTVLDAAEPGQIGFFGLKLDTDQVRDRQGLKIYYRVKGIPYTIQDQLGNSFDYDTNLGEDFQSYVDLTPSGENYVTIAPGQDLGNVVIFPIDDFIAEGVPDQRIEEITKNQLSQLNLFANFPLDTFTLSTGDKRSTINGDSLELNQEGELLVNGVKRDEGIFKVQFERNQGSPLLKVYKTDNPEKSDRGSAEPRRFEQVILELLPDPNVAEPSYRLTDFNTSASVRIWDDDQVGFRFILPGDRANTDPDQKGELKVVESADLSDIQQTAGASFLVRPLSDPDDKYIHLRFSPQWKDHLKHEFKFQLKEQPNLLAGEAEFRINLALGDLNQEKLVIPQAIIDNLREAGEIVDPIFENGQIQGISLTRTKDNWAKPFSFVLTPEDEQGIVTEERYLQRQSGSSRLTTYAQFLTSVLEQTKEVLISYTDKIDTVEISDPSDRNQGTAVDITTALPIQGIYQPGTRLDRGEAWLSEDRRVALSLEASSANETKLVLNHLRAEPNSQGFYQVEKSEVLQTVAGDKSFLSFKPDGRLVLIESKDVTETIQFNQFDDRIQSLDSLVNSEVLSQFAPLESFSFNRYNYQGSKTTLSKGEQLRLVGNVSDSQQFEFELDIAGNLSVRRGQTLKAIATNVSQVNFSSSGVNVIRESIKEAWTPQLSNYNLDPTYFAVQNNGEIALYTQGGEKPYQKQLAGVQEEMVAADPRAVVFTQKLPDVPVVFQNDDANNPRLDGAYFDTSNWSRYQKITVAAASDELIDIARSLKVNLNVEGEPLYAVKFDNAESPLVLTIDDPHFEKNTIISSFAEPLGDNEQVLNQAEIPLIGDASGKLPNFSEAFGQKFKESLEKNEKIDASNVTAAVTQALVASFGGGELNQLGKEGTFGVQGLSVNADWQFGTLLLNVTFQKNFLPFVTELGADLGLPEFGLELDGQLKGYLGGKISLSPAIRITNPSITAKNPENKTVQTGSEEPSRWQQISQTIKNALNGPEYDLEVTEETGKQGVLNRFQLNTSEDENGNPATGLELYLNLDFEELGLQSTLFPLQLNASQKSIEEFVLGSDGDEIIIQLKDNLLNQIGNADLVVRGLRYTGEPENRSNAKDWDYQQISLSNPGQINVEGIITIPNATIKSQGEIRLPLRPKTAYNIDKIELYLGDSSNSQSTPQLLESILIPSSILNGSSTTAELPSYEITRISTQTNNFLGFVPLDNGNEQFERFNEQYGFLNELAKNPSDASKFVGASDAVLSELTAGDDYHEARLELAVPITKPKETNLRFYRKYPFDIKIDDVTERTYSTSDLSSISLNFNKHKQVNLSIGLDDIVDNSELQDFYVEMVYLPSFAAKDLPNSDKVKQAKTDEEKIYTLLQQDTFGTPTTIYNVGYTTPQVNPEESKNQPWNKQLPLHTKIINSQDVNTGKSVSNSALVDSATHLIRLADLNGLVLNLDSSEFLKSKSGNDAIVNNPSHFDDFVIRIIKKVDENTALIGKEGDRLGTKILSGRANPNDPNSPVYNNGPFEVLYEIRPFGSFKKVNLVKDYIRVNVDNPDTQGEYRIIPLYDVDDFNIEQNSDGSFKSVSAKNADQSKLTDKLLHIVSPPTIPTLVFENAQPDLIKIVGPDGKPQTNSLGTPLDFVHLPTANFWVREQNNNGSLKLNLDEYYIAADGEPLRKALVPFSQLTNTAQIQPRVTGQFAAAFDVTTGFPTDLPTPSLEFDLGLFGYVNKNLINQETNVKPDGKAFAVGVNDLSLNLGTFVTDLLKPVIDSVDEIFVNTGVYQVIDLLDTDTQFLESIGIAGLFDTNKDDKVSVLELLEAGNNLGAALSSLQKGKQVAPSQLISTIVKFADLVKQFREVANNEGLEELIVGLYDQYTKAFGDVAQKPNTSGQNPTTTEENSSTADTNDKTLQRQNALDLDESSNQSGNSDNAKITDQAPAQKGLFEKLANIGLSIPVLDDPLLVLDLIFGEDIDLVKFKPFPQKQQYFLHTELEKGLPEPLDFLSVGVEGNLLAGVDLSFGFDTYGLRQFETGEHGENFLKLLDSFYLQDWTDSSYGSGNIVDKPELFLNLEAGAKGEASLKVLGIEVASGEIGGGLGASLNLDLDEFGEHKEERNQDADGKIRISDWEKQGANIFDFYGDLYVYFKAVAEAFGITLLNEKWKYPFYEFRLSNSVDIAGKSTQAYIEGATIFFDRNFNLSLDEDEPFTLTKADGSYDLNLNPVEYDLDGDGELTIADGQVVSLGGLDTESNLPITAPMISEPTATITSPLTTLGVTLSLREGGSTESRLNQVKEIFGIPAEVDLNSFDAIAAAKSGDPLGLIVYQAHVVIDSLLTNLTNISALYSQSDDDSTLFAQTLQSIATVLNQTVVNQEQTLQERLLTLTAQIIEQHLQEQILPSLENSDQISTITSQFNWLATQLQNIYQKLVKNPDELLALSTDEVLASFNDITSFKSLLKSDLPSNINLIEQSLITLEEATAQIDNLLTDDTVTNTPPVAVDDNFTVNEDSTNNILEVLTNDSDADSDTLTITAVTEGNNGGKITISNDNQTLIYTPTANFNGIETFTYTIDDGSGTTAQASVEITVNNFRDTPTLKEEATPGIFTLEDLPADLFFSLNSNNQFTQVIEIGVFTVDDEQGTINSLSPETFGYQEAALENSKVIFSILPDSHLPNGLSLADIERVLPLDEDTSFGFYLVKENSTQAAFQEMQENGSSNEEIMLSNSSLFQTEVQSDGNWVLTWTDDELNTMTVDLEVQEQQPIKLGTQLQNEQGLEVIDLSDESNSQAVEVTIHREAAVDNLVSLYKVQADGSVTDPLTGETITVTEENQSRYVRAALANRVEGLDISGSNQTETTLSGELEAGEIYAPMIIFDPAKQVNDNLANPDAWLEDVEVYFPWMEVNSDGEDHIRLLGDNHFGFEDLPTGGDNDFNDLIVKVGFSSVG